MGNLSSPVLVTTYFGMPELRNPAKCGTPGNLKRKSLVTASASFLPRSQRAGFLGVADIGLHWLSVLRAPAQRGLFTASHNAVERPSIVAAPAFIDSEYVNTNFFFLFIQKRFQRGFE